VHQQVGQVQHRPQAEATGAPEARPEASPAARQVLARWALGEALGRGHRYIDTEDLLLALYREADGAAAQALARLGAGESQVRGAVTALLAESGPNRSGA
jgi:ATP-dependent Clp protease ATP-binding subunit ClpA